jgi:hypothetical protein
MLCVETTKLTIGLPGVSTKYPIIACADSPQAFKDIARWRLSGTDDGAEINKITEEITNGRTRGGGVQIAPGTVTITATPILMKTALNVSALLENATSVKARKARVAGLFMLYDGPTHAFTIDGFHMDGNFAEGVAGSSLVDAFYFNHSSGTAGPNGTNWKGTAGGDANAGARNTTPDGTSSIRNITGGAFSSGTRDFFYATSTSAAEVGRGYRLESWHLVLGLGGNVASQHGINIDNVSDGTIIGVHLGEVGSNCFNISGASWRISASKGYTAGQYGFYADTNVTIVGCDAQDCDDDGFHIVGDGSSLSGCTADSNARTTTGAGFWFGANDITGAGLVAHNNASGAPETPTQDYGFEFNGARTGLSIVGTSLNSVSSGVAGTQPAAATNFIRITRAGSGAASIAGDHGTDTNGLWRVGT